MLSVGSNLVSSADSLKKVSVEYLFHGIRNPKQEIASRIRQIRIVRDIDKKQYALLKRQLPYVVCAMFSPPYRRTENFAYTEYFIVDIDHVSEKQFDLHQLRQRIEKDERVVLSFVSPGEDGLKLLFRLKERCYDAGLYSLFYKSFVRSFSQQYGLEQVVDERTSDVCRACFISVDADVYYAPDAVAVDLNSYVDLENVSSMFDLQHRLEQESRQQSAAPANEEREIDPDKETMNRIKALLNPNQKKVQRENVPYVPQELNDIIDGLKSYISETGIQILEVKNIQYAKKMKFKMGLKQAEINLFYGKRGFNVVQSPRCGTSAELNQLVADLIDNYLQIMI